MTVGAIAAQWPATRMVLEKHGIDYCCQGHRSLRAAVAAAKAHLPEVLGALRKVAARPPARKGPVRVWTGSSASELADHIESRHHAYMKENLPRLTALLEKVRGAHDRAHGPMLRKLQEVFLSLKQEIESHLRKEERVLFPLIRQMDAHLVEGGPKPVCHCGTVENPIRQMRSEHETAGEALARLRELSHGYALPDDACASFRALYEGLQAMEDDLHEHIHLENNILFPKAVSLEERTVSAT